MTTVELNVIAADLSAYLDRVASGETILYESDHQPIAELPTPGDDSNRIVDKGELAHRRQLVQDTRELRASIKRESGVHPDSTEMIREIRANE